MACCRGAAAIAVACLLAWSPAADAQDTLAGLAPALEARIAEHRGTVGLAVIDLDSSESLSIRGDEPFPSASVIKVPVLVELFHQIETGRLSLDDPLVLLEADKQPGAGILRHFAAPHQLTVGDAAFLMIALSDNAASNLIIDKVGIRAVGARMEELGLAVTRLHSRLFDRSSSIDMNASEAYGVGVTTPAEMVRLFALIHRGEAVSLAASERMAAMLREQFYRDAIPRHLSDVPVANKTGSISAARHDCGIVYAEGFDFAICVFTKENEDRSWQVDNEAHVLIADLTRIVHDGLSTANTGRRSRVDP